MADSKDSPQEQDPTSLVEKKVNMILGVMERILSVAEKLSKSLPFGQEVLAQLTNQQKDMDEMATQLAKNMDPQDQIEISRLKTAFQNCATKAKAFLYACQSMASYGVSDKLAAIINTQLDKGKFDVLNSFIKDVLRKLKLCAQKFRELNSEKSEVVAKADKLMSKYKTLANTASQQGRSEVKKSRDTVTASNIARAVQVASGIGIVATPVLGVLGFVPRKWAVTVVGVGACFLVGASIVGIRCAGSTSNAKDRAIYCLSEGRKLASVEQCIANLSIAMDKIMRQINDVEGLTQKAEEDIQNLEDDVGGVMDGVKLTDIQRESIKQQLVSFRDELSAILSITGERGEMIDTITKPVERSNEQGLVNAQASED